VLKALRLEPMHGRGSTERLEQWSERMFLLGQGALEASRSEASRAD
jgi:hypothetical protein